MDWPKPSEPRANVENTEGFELGGGHRTVESNEREMMKGTRAMKPKMDVPLRFTVCFFESGFLEAAGVCDKTLATNYGL